MPRRRKPDVNLIFAALADASRRAIVQHLSRGPQTVSRLAVPLEITLAAVVQHLQVLEQCGLVRTEKVGRTRTCRIDSAGLSAAEHWLHNCRSTWERRLDRLGDLLIEPDP